jgi:hypothetical protein
VFAPRQFEERDRQRHAATQLRIDLTRHLKQGDDAPRRGELPRLAAVVRLLVRLYDTASVDDVEAVREEAEEEFPDLRRAAGREDPVLAEMLEQLSLRRNALKAAGVEVIETDEARRRERAVKAIAEAVASHRVRDPGRRP